MPLKKLKKQLEQQKPFDWLALIVLASFAFVMQSIVTNDIEKFGREMDIEAEHLHADLLIIQKLNQLEN